MSGARNESEHSPAAGFTVIVCDTCADGGLPDIALLRETVRRSPHGMLVRAHCPLGTMLCHARKASANAGRVVLVQPCTTGRDPLGAAVIVGPVRTAEDLAALARWLKTTPVDVNTLPSRLRGIPHSRRQSMWN